MRFQVLAPLDRMKETPAGPAIKDVGGDRGFDSKVYNGICPKPPSELKKRMKEERFVKLQRRRSQTESRIAVFKNGFLMRFQILAPGDPATDRGMTLAKAG